MRSPHFFPENGSIGFISPSFGAATEPYRSAFLNARAKFEAMGYRCVTGPNAFVQEGVGISNTPEACAAEVNDFFTRKDTDILMSLGGGELMCTILDAVDFPAIAAARAAGSTWVRSCWVACCWAAATTTAAGAPTTTTATGVEAAASSPAVGISRVEAAASSTAAATSEPRSPGGRPRSHSSHALSDAAPARVTPGAGTCDHDA